MCIRDRPYPDSRDTFAREAEVMYSPASTKGAANRRSLIITNLARILTDTVAH